MRFPPAFLDEIRDRLPISQVIGTRVSWDRRKTNASRGDWWACCPFHGEKTPSFHCEDSKGRYYCFGCGASGDHFRFLVELDGLSFPEAVERLADQAGLPMPVMDAREQKRLEQQASLFDVMEMAAQFFEAQLQAGAGAKARAYLRDRGLAPATQAHFRLGYAPDSRNALKEHLAAEGVTKEQMEACGLLVFGPDIPVSYDRFRERVMFPIPNARGKVIAFGGRALRADVPAKYLNSPETELFHKSRVLYNFAGARRPVQDSGQVIAVEGYMDVIALHAAGFENAVAPLGTALTETQMELLWRLQPEPVLCFDGDEAGLRAAFRAVTTILPGLRPGRSARFALLPEGKDPDDLLREEGERAMQEILDEAMSLADMVWMRDTGSASYDTPEKRAELESRLRQTTAQIGDESVRRHYGQDIVERLAVFFGNPPAEQGRRAERNAQAGSWRAGSGSNAAGGLRGRGAAAGRFAASPSLLSSRLVKRRAAGVPLREAALICTIVHHPAILLRRFDEFAAMPFGHGDCRAVQGAILDIAAGWVPKEPDENEWPDTETLRKGLAERSLGEALAGMEEQLRNNRIWQALPEAAFEDALDGWRQAYALQMRAHGLMSELHAAEKALAAEESEENFARLVRIREELAREDGTEALIEGFGVSSGRPVRIL